ncbi:MAG: SDR family NAD(P)-dependent oxidoreductase [Actinomycetota bacterium]
MGFDSSSTTDEVLAGQDLTGKTAIVTGGSGGIGEETARALTANGAAVTIAARNADRLAAAAGRIASATGQQVETGVLDLADPASVRAFAETWLSGHRTLDLLMNNAGVMGFPLRRSAEGFELQFATNHLGHFLLTNLLLPALDAAGSARVVNTTSAGHNVSTVDLDDVNYLDRPYSPLGAYGQSKTANIWFASELDRRWADRGVHGFSVHPGGIGGTDLGRDLAPEFMDEIRAAIDGRTDGLSDSKTPTQGAATQCWAATDPALATRGGSYLVDCQIAKPGNNIYKHHAPWAYDTDGAARLWDLSNQLLGTDF